MRTISLLFAGLAGLHATAHTSAPDPRAAAQQFLDATKARDFTAVGKLWGTSEWLVRDHYSETEFHQRALIVMCYLNPEQYEITDVQPDTGKAMAVTIRLTARGKTSVTQMRTVNSGTQGWLVESVDIKNLTPSCK